MKIQQDVEAILNEQLRHEFESAYAYLGLAAALQTAGFDGFAHWMKKQYEEELTHAMKIFEFIHERQGTVQLQNFECPNFSLECPCEAFQKAYEFEIKNTQNIHKAYEVALKAADYATLSFLEWFINEQVEEEAQCQRYVTDTHRAVKKGCLCTMMSLDREAGKR